MEVPLPVSSVHSYVGKSELEPINKIQQNSKITHTPLVNNIVFDMRKYLLNFSVQTRTQVGVRRNFYENVLILE